MNSRAINRKKIVSTFMMNLHQIVNKSICLIYPDARGKRSIVKDEEIEHKHVFQPRYTRNIEHLRHKREAFDQEAHDRMNNIILVSSIVDNLSQYQRG